MLTRREVLKQAGVVAALATTAPWWLVRRAHAARDAKLIVWMPVALAPQVDKLLKEQCYAYAKQAGIKENELAVLRHRHRPMAAETGGGARSGESAGCHQVRPGSNGALSLPGPPPGGDRPGREDAANGRGVSCQSPSIPSCTRARPTASPSPSVPGP